MAYASCQHKDMPYTMTVSKFFIESVENNTYRIEQSASHKSSNACNR
jgi:hypothetical protein